MALEKISGRDALSGEPVTVSLEDGRIAAIAPGREDETTWLSPGFIDLQVNGYLGSDLNCKHVDPDVVIALTHKLIAIGVTTYLPTIITASEERIIAALRAVARARRADPIVAHAVPFVHLEGPHISRKDGPRGAHPREYVRPAKLTEFERWQAASGNLVGMVTISPHNQAAMEYISKLASKGVIMAIGHTDATPAQIHAAAAAGASLSTHLGNGAGSPLPRHPNLLWAQLADDRLGATFIGDGNHLPFDTLRVMLRAKDLSRSVLVSDVVSAGGLPPGIYNSGVGGSVEVTLDGRVVSAQSRQVLAGSYHPLIDGVANVAYRTGFSLSAAVRMATETPGRLIGSGGVLRPGAPADLISFRSDPDSRKLELLTVLARGVEWHPRATT